VTLIDRQPSVDDPRSHVTLRERGTIYRATVVLVGAVLLLGAALRFYRLGAQRLWLDELYTVELVRGGPGAIWYNAFVDIWPPLSNLPFWLTAQLVGISPLSLRFVSALAATIALPLYQRAGTLALDRWTALLATALLAIAPLAVYYAQEARSYALPLAALIGTLVGYERLRRRSSTANWALYAGLAALAVQLHYLNAVLVSIQLVALLVLARDRRAALIGGGATLLVMAAVTAPFLLGAILVARGWTPERGGLALGTTAQTMLAGDPRIASRLTRAVALGATLIGTLPALADQRTRRALLPHLGAIIGLCLLMFVALPLLGKPAPAYNDRQFLLLLPSVLLCFSAGIRRLMRRPLTTPLAALLLGVLVATSSTGLWAYFGSFSKSPEALVADAITMRYRPGDVVVSDSQSYSVDAALHYYDPAVPLYRCRSVQRGQARVTPYTTILIGYRDDAPLADLDTLARSRRVWLVERAAPAEECPAMIEQRYQLYQLIESAPFRLRLFERRVP
jgi:hypothetical protein